MQITLEGLPAPIPAAEGETILLSLQRAGVPFPFSCQSGTCGACKCRLVDGRVVDLGSSAHALSAEERTQGLILACRSLAVGRAVLRRV